MLGNKKCWAICNMITWYKLDMCFYISFNISFINIFSESQKKIYNFLDTYMLNVCFTCTSALLSA